MEMYFFFFFFKQKTAYEMLISDWSSDVCSSDLYLLNLADTNSFVLFALASVLVSMALVPISVSPTPTPDFTAPEPLGLRALYRISPLGTIGALGTGMANAALYSMAAVYAGTVGLTVPQIAVFISANRSEEHTSELQSLMRNSHAVFCL